MFHNRRIKNIASAVGLIICLLASSIGQGVYAADKEQDIYSYDFEDGALPSGFNVYDFRAENGKLKVIGKWAQITYSDISKDCSVEFKIQGIENRIIPNFTVTLRDDAKFCYINNSVTSNEKTDKFILESVADGIKGEYSSEKMILSPEKEHSLKFSAKGNKYEMSLDGKTVISTEYELKSDSSNFPVSFALTAADNTAGVIGFYMDDYKIKGTESAAVNEEFEAPANAIYAYDFNNGELPNIFDASDFKVEKGKLRVVGSAAEINLPNVPKDCTLEFTLKPISGCIVPKFYVNFRGVSDFYYNNKAVMSEYNTSQIALVNEEDWKMRGNDSWSTVKPHFSDIKEYKLKYIADGTHYEMYIDNNQIIDATYDDGAKKSKYPVRIIVSPDKGTVGTIGFYLDNIVVTPLEVKETESDETANDIAKVVPESWMVSKGEGGRNYAKFDINFKVPVGIAVNSFWITVNGKYSELVKIDTIKGETEKVLPVTLRYYGDISAKDVRIHIKD